VKRALIALAGATAVLLGSGGAAQAAPKPKPEQSYGECVSQASKAADPRAARALCVRPNSKTSVPLAVTTDQFMTVVSGTGLRPGTTVSYVFTDQSGERVSGTFDDYLGDGDTLVARDGTFAYSFCTTCEGFGTPINRGVVVTGTSASGQPVTAGYVYQVSDCPPLA